MKLYTIEVVFYSKHVEKYLFFLFGLLEATLRVPELIFPKMSLPNLLLAFLLQDIF